MAEGQARAQPSYGRTRTGRKTHIREPGQRDFSYCSEQISPAEAEPDPFGCCKTCLYRWSAAALSEREER